MRGKDEGGDGQSPHGTTTETGLTDYWCEHALLPSGHANGVRISILDDRIVAVTAGVKARAADHKLPGVTMPGLANAHSHAFHRALRGRTHLGRGSFWTWRDQMYAVAERLDPETYLELARAVFAEMVISGYTVVGEFHYLHHGLGGVRYADPNEMGKAMIQAAKEAGIRLTLIDTLYLTGGLSGAGYEPLSPRQERFGDGDVDGWISRVSRLRDSDQVRIGAGLHSVRAVPRDQLRIAAEAARAGMGSRIAPQMPLHLHVSEQLGENAATTAYFGLSPVELLAAEGVLGATTQAVHATHLSDADVAALAESGTGAVFCPMTERDLADGIGRAFDLNAAGVPLSLGSDQQVAVDPFVEMRALEGHERLVTNERGRFNPEDLLTFATAHGYDALGWHGGGHLAPGALADFVSVRMDSVRTVGARPSQIMFAASCGDIDTVVVGGQRVVEGGRHRLGSVALLLRVALDRISEDGV